MLSAQLCSPVRWRQTMLQLAGLAGDDPAEHHEGERLFVELGPGGSLTSLIRRIAPGGHRPAGLHARATSTCWSRRIAGDTAAARLRRRCITASSSTCPNGS